MRIKRKLKWVDVACESCGANAGERCWGKPYDVWGATVRTHVSTVHRVRRRASELAQAEAYRARS